MEESKASVARRLSSEPKRTTIQKTTTRFVNHVGGRSQTELLFEEHGGGLSVPPAVGSGLYSNNMPSATCRPSPQRACGDNLVSRYSEELSEGGERLRILRTNGIPNHRYHVVAELPNPNGACEQPLEFRLPSSPLKAERFQDTPLGIVGVLRTGGFLYNHLSNLDGRMDVAFHPDTEGPSLDRCNGHADPSCSYHYHAVSKLNECLRGSSSFRTEGFYQHHSSKNIVVLVNVILGGSWAVLMVLARSGEEGAL